MNKCILCGNNKIKQIYSDKQYKIVKCINCSLCFLSKFPSRKEIFNYYLSNYFKNQNDTGYTDYELLEKDLFYEAEYRLNIIKKYQSKGRLLDIGCAYGHFLSKARDYGYKVSGIDISKEAVIRIKKRFNIDAVLGEASEKDLPKNFYDVVTLWDVVEHLPEPLSSLKAVSEIQKKGNFLFITTPNIESVDARLFGRWWYGFKRIPEHLYFFSPGSLTVLLNKAGYKVVKVFGCGFYRNINYLIDQTKKYNQVVYRVLKLFAKVTKTGSLSVYWPFTNMMVIAKKQ